MKKVLAALLVLAALFSSVASSASAEEATEVAAVPVVDALNRTENPLSNGGKWLATQWATGVKTGADYGSAGWGPSSAFLTGPAAAYWNTSHAGTASKGTAAGLTLNVSPEIAERYVSVWLDMPNPGAAKSGYQLRWTLVSGLNTYAVKLSKWVAGAETVLAANASVSIPSGTRLMISDSGGTVTAWKGSGSTVTPLLTAADSTYASGYAGIEAAGNISRSLDFRAGTYEIVPSAYWGAWIGGSVYSAEPGEYGDAPWDGETWDFFEEDAGKPVSLIHFGQPAPWSQKFASYPLELTRARGALPVMSMYSNGATLKEIAEGKKDADLRAWAEAAAAYAHPFFFVWNPQMNGTWYQPGKEAAESPQTYKEAWWRFHDVVEEEGATNVTWTWCPNTVFTGSTSLSSLYPGKASEGKGKYVDWTCVSGYNRGTNPINPDSWKSFSTVFSATYNELQSLASDKPVMIGETASSEIGGSKSTWITDALSTQVPINFPKIKAFVWWNKNESGMDWPIESSAGAEAAFGSSIASNYYADNEFGGIPALTPISPLPKATAPGMATVSSVTPAGPANNNTVTVKGTAPAGATAIHLYTESNCAGMPIASTRPDTYASGMKVSVADDTTTTFYAEATNSWGYSACSETSATYVEDSTPPAAPTVTGSNPPSPANENSPKIIGSAEAGTTVNLYNGKTCGSKATVTGTAAQFASPGFTVSVINNSTPAYVATATDAAGNVSACSAVPFIYVEDSLPPMAPTVSSTNPASGANDNSPKVVGSAVPNTTVKIYSTSNCTGSPLATGTAAVFASPGISVSVADNSTTTFKATATDTANNTSACSSTSATYVEGTPKIYWGAWMGGNAYDPEEKAFTDAPWDSGTWNLFEEHADKEVSIVHFGQPAPWNQAFAEGPLKQTRERGAIPLMDMDPDGVTLKEIVEGKKDSHFKTWATAVKNYAHPMFFRWAWEMNGTWFQWGAEAAGNPTLYKEAWWHLHELFAEQGASNITWVWCPNLVSGETTPLSSLYPGDKYVDWTCLDGYNWGTNPVDPDSWKSFSTLYTASYEELLSLAPSKPIMIGEIGSTEYGGEKSAWIADAIGTQIPKNFPSIKAVVWYNKWDGGRDWPIETSASAETAFANAIDAPIYAGNTFGSLPTLEKIKPLP